MKRSFIAIFAPLAILAACSDDSTAPTGDRLTRAEALSVADQMMASGEQTAFTSRSTGSNARFDPRTITQDLNVTSPCPSGGNVKLALKTDLAFDEKTGSLDLDVKGSLTHAACGYPSESITITVDGNPAIQLEAHAEMRNFLPAGVHTIDMNGGFRWRTTDGRSGTCPIDVESVMNFTNKTKTTEGDICGHKISEKSTWT